jgi:hypothetical protein
MKMLKSRAMAILFAAILTISIGGSMTLIPSASAHSPPWTLATHAFTDVEPNPCGVGQQMLIFGWINQIISGAMLANTIRAVNFTFVITQPNGVKLTNYVPYVPNSGSEYFYTFTPTQVGNYTLNFTYGGQVQAVNATSTTGILLTAGDIYEPSSASQTFTVTETPSPTVPYGGYSPLPTAYWTRPIYQENQNWVSVASNWVGGAANEYYTQESGAAPRTPHIMWTKPIEFGGLVGGSVTQANDSAIAVPQIAMQYFTGMSYEDRNSNPLIVNGVLFYQEAAGETGGGAGTTGPEVAVDLTTGKVLWTSTTFYPSFAQIYGAVTVNQYGPAGAILWQTSGPGIPSGTWVGYNAFTYTPEYNLTNVPSGTQVYLNNGEIDIYQFSYSTVTNTGWIAQFNESATILNCAIDNTYPLEAFPNGMGISIDCKTYGVYNYNTTITADLTTPPTTTGETSSNVASPHIVGVIPGEYILGSSSNVALIANSNPNTNPWVMWCLSDHAGSQGQVLWIQDYAAPPGNLTEMLNTQPMDPYTNEWTMTYQETGQRLAYSLATGDLVWGPTAIAQTGFQYYSSREGVPAYGNLYVAGYGGIVYCYSMKNGTLLWTYGNGGEGNTTQMYNNGPWGLYPTHITEFADGMLYTFSGEHGNGNPLYQGELMRCLNATTGKQIWTLSSSSAAGLGTSMQPLAIADGYAEFFNCYDNQVYVIGQGPSETTVSAPSAGLSFGQSVVISGTVMDISAGTQQNEQAMDFPHGVPCASDASMSAWMSYVYQQQPEPTNFTGVKVQLSVLDSNGNYRPIGTATTDSSGMYTLTWTPNIPGNFTVYADFAGNNGYWPSNAETSFNVMSAPPTPAPTATPVTGLASTGTVELGIAAVIIVIVIIGAVIMLMLRKRP